MKIQGLQDVDLDFGWTNKINIKIDKDCYLSSSTKFTPGTVIGNNIIVGLGSIVTKKI